MSNKVELRSKLRHCMEIPTKILLKVRDSYVESMKDCASKVGYGSSVGCPAAQVSRLPRSFSVNYLKPRNDKRFEELLAAVSKIVGSDQMELNVREEELREQKMENYGTMKRCYTSVGLGKIGRIDEDRPCYFEEDKLYTRSRSNAAKIHF